MFIVPSGPTSGHRTLKRVGLIQREHATSTMVLLPLIADHVDVPIVAAGGICDARSMAAAMVLGAEGVQMGTRLLACADSPVHANFKQAVLDADDNGTVLLPLGGRRMMRVIRTPAAQRMDAEGTPGTSALERVQRLYFDGDLDASVANTGQVAGRIDDLRPAADIISEMWRGCRDVLSATATRTAGYV
ncbi:NAD(P)H-dependent flavin oxidoreductase [Mycolicibacterium llatzerense]|uniref:NAD(P)H-dependent flavin oxidoreductase n=3 Tax=Mycolicibacterium llatzerense TaxID=280871 RepID=UPI003899448C